MFFAPLIEAWGVAELAADLKLPSKNVRRWIDSDSIPADWFSDIADAALRRGRPHISVAYLADLARQRRLQRNSDQPQQAVAA